MPGFSSTVEVPMLTRFGITVTMSKSVVSTRKHLLKEVLKMLIAMFNVIMLVFILIIISGGNGN